jgi:hypothetical protein
MFGITETKLFKKALSWVLAKAGGGDLEGAKGEANQIMSPTEIEKMLDSEAGAKTLDALLSRQAQEAKGAATAKSLTSGELNEEAIAQDIESDFSSDMSLPEMIVSNQPGSGPIRRRLEEETGARSFSAAAGVAIFLARVIVAVARRYRSGTHHDPLPTAVEELFRAAYLAEVGKFTWDTMKTKAQRMWIDDGENPGFEGHGGGYLLRRLEQIQASKPDFKIDVVGHSAGSIAICNMFAALDAKQRKLRFRNVVFLAPAVRLDLFARWITRGPKVFERFRMFTMADEWEKLDQLLGAIYPRSLLYLVSGCFEDRPDDAIAGMGRFLREPTTSAGRDFDDVRQWLKADDRLIYAPSDDGAAEGLRTRSEHHGGFHEDKSTLESLLSIARVTS